MNSFIIYIDCWCPMCVRFGSLVTYLDIFNNISKADLRNYDGDLICKAKSVKQIASVDENNRVFYGYDSIWQIIVRLPYETQGSIRSHFGNDVAYHARVSDREMIIPNNVLSKDLLQNS